MDSWQHVEIQRRGLSLSGRVYGPEGAPIVVLIHGFLDCAASWHPVASALASEFRLLAPDMRGFGRSGWVGDGGYYHFYDYYDDVLAWLRHLGAESFWLVGHSMGGSIAAGVAAISGERCKGVVLLEGMGPPANDPQHSVARLQVWSQAMAREPVQGDVAQRRAARKIVPSVEVAARRLRKYNPRLDEQRSVALAAELTEAVEGGVAFRHDPLHMTPAAKPYWIQEAQVMWAAIHGPVLLLSGAESTMPTQDLPGRFAHLRSARSFVVPAAGHNIHHDRPELVAAAVQAWLSGRAEALPGALHEGFAAPGRPASH